MKPWAKIGISILTTGFVCVLSGCIWWVAPATNDAPAAILFPFALFAASAFDDAQGLVAILGVVQFPIYGFILGLAWVRDRLRRSAATTLIVHASAVLTAFGCLAVQAYRLAPEKQAIQNRYTAWHSALHEGHFADAYAVMSPDYRAHHTVEDFGRDFAHYGDEFYGLRSGFSLRINGRQAWLYPFESRWCDSWSGPDYEWIKLDTQWYLTGEYRRFLD